VLRFDLPGHGGSAPVTFASVDDLARLVLELADAQGWDRFAYAGISLGGAIGAVLAVRHADRLSSLALVCSSARFGEPSSWRSRAALVRASGTAALASTLPARWFTPSFVSSPAAAAMVADLLAADDEAYAASCEALASYDLRGSLGLVKVPTLVIAGREDLATPPSHARELADGIAGASLVEVAGAAHLANVERPAVVTAALLSHLASSRHDEGVTVRREVLGDDHVDRAIAATTPFTATFQDFITRYAWGEIWTRPGLDRRTRSCVTLTALVAHGHLDELAMHIRAALRIGLTPEEIGEVLLQTAVYCGVPAANAAFDVAQRVLREG
jgi:3-oxoadipate enol-lactonase/4-carboxymuconolactone decarboxylase